MTGRGHRGTRAVVVALVTSVASAAAAVAAFVVTESSTLLAAAILPAAATVQHLLLLVAGRRTRRAADEEHPFGHGRERYYWSFAVTTVLVVLGAVAAVAEGVRTISDPAPVVDPEWAYAALAAGGVLAAVGLRVAVVQADAVRGRATWRRFVRNAEVPSLPAVIVQQTATITAALVGLGAVAAAELLDEAAWDGIGAVAIGALLGVVALVLLAQVRSLLIGRSATRKDVESIRAAVEIDPTVKQLIHLRTQHQGPEELFVGMRVELDHTLTFPEVSEVVNRIERTVRRAVPMARVMYIEPDVTDSRRAGPTIGEHEPGHEVPQEIRAKQKIEDRRGALGVGIPLEEGDREPS
ncbi:cation diffusion facilitator family transporter [Iamia sp. SCSIO 61187]|uniref:cation diffusion facilitator family transporter n=1 Tax=Iamia sp. SCSIO 61187 TaxID=2722752 RepID=UPI001C6312BB|nr:cation diffusion facilitator family transporter [Iamia sp. SCSIO 61187]QYG91993.1 cation diffusion facilitator family transporter [Iamia sp. SCSIO 61187]